METNSNALILVVDDSADLNLALCEILTSYGYRVLPARDGFAALDVLRTARPTERPDVVLCDIMMPGMDGYTLLQHTRADVELRTLPFIFLTALSSLADQRRAKRIGIDDYLTKPIDSGDLVAAIENVIQRRRAVEEETRRRLDELRSRIVGLLQHEFRTPLTFVLGYAELLANTNETNLDWDEMRQAAAAILDGGKRLQALIEGFLLLATLQNRTLDAVDLDRLDAAQLWRDVVREMQPQAEAANLTLEVVEPPRPLFVTGDAHLIEESLRRLLDNAIRYRRRQSTTVRMSVTDVVPYIGLSIQDEGAGISEAAVAELMQPFEQPGREQRTAAGAGLSLALVKHIMRLHGGRLQVQSAFGQGSTFTLWLPAAVAEPALR
jgi:two-component system, sensor histidine kinase and response regulator